jgi:ABC-type transport system substrate-binding protein
MPRPLRCIAAVVVTTVLAAGGLVVTPAHGRTGPTTQASQTPRSGGTLKIMHREDTPQGFAVHETATISTVWPSSPCFNNLVYFDPLKGKESVDTIIGELAEKWSWQDNYRNLVFFLRKNVKWHDGKPFTSKDVKFTFDMVREAPNAEGNTSTPTSRSARASAASSPRGASPAGC